MVLQLVSPTPIHLVGPISPIAIDVDLHYHLSSVCGYCCPHSPPPIVVILCEDYNLDYSLLELLVLHLSLLELWPSIQLLELGSHLCMCDGDLVREWLSCQFSLLHPPLHLLAYTLQCSLCWTPPSHPLLDLHLSMMSFITCYVSDNDLHLLLSCIHCFYVHHLLQCLC